MIRNDEFFVGTDDDIYTVKAPIAESVECWEKIINSVVDEVIIRMFDKLDAIDELRERIRDIERKIDMR